MQARIVATIRKIPRGKVSSYGAIARAAGYPGYARQVAQILHRLPGLQWHRVLGAGGEIKLRGDSALEQCLRLQAEGVSFRGRRVKTTGDGMLAVFDGPARGVRCAEAVRDAVEELGVELRAGLHVGECELRGEDVGGLAVHIGARIAGLARPGEILVSRTVRDLVAGSGLQFADRGEQELKGVPERWPLYAVAS